MTIRLTQAPVPPNYAFERTAKPPRNYRRDRAAAQRER